MQCKGLKFEAAGRLSISNRIITAARQLFVYTKKGYGAGIATCVYTYSYHTASLRWVPWLSTQSNSEFHPAIPNFSKARWDGTSRPGSVPSWVLVTTDRHTHTQTMTAVLPPGLRPLRHNELYDLQTVGIGSLKLLLTPGIFQQADSDSDWYTKSGWFKNDRVTT